MLVDLMIDLNLTLCKKYTTQNDGLSYPSFLLLVCENEMIAWECVIMFW